MGKRAKYDPSEYPVRDWGGKPKQVQEDYRQETSRRFHDMMDNAMMVSFHKYGPVANAYPEKVRALDSLMVRIDAYLNGIPAKKGKPAIPPGNAEYLVDAANFAMIEFMHPSKEAVLIHTDSDGSPGRVSTNPTVYDEPTQAANNHLPDAADRF
jgi:hypothetical protein